MKRALMAGLIVAAAVASFAAAEGTKYGSGVTVTTATPIEKLLASPEAYVGKTVRVDGVISAVCEMAGCWMELRPDLADPNAAAALRFKVKDGEIVFPVAAKGKKASAQGVFGPVSGEMAKEYERDREAAKGGDMKTAVPKYQVSATGAVIY